MELQKRISDRLETLLNIRVKGEYESFWIYNMMSNWCDCYGYYDAKEVFRKYADEEMKHARKLEDYIMELETENSMLKNKTDDIASIKSMVESIYNEHHFFDNTAYPEVYFKETTRDEN